MGGYIQDCVDLLGFSLSWISDRGVLGLYLTLLAITVVGGVLSFGSLMVFSGLGFLRFLLSLGVMGVFMLVFFYFGLKSILFALKAKGFGNAEYTPMKFLKTVILMLLNAITVLLPWVEIRMLAINVGLAVVSVVCIGLALAVSRLFWLAFFLAAFAWVLAVLYCSLRLMFPLYEYLSGKSGVKASVRGSWEATNGNVTRILARFYLTWGFIQGGLMAVIYPFYFIGLFLSILAMGAAFATGSAFFGGIAIFAIMGCVIAVIFPASFFLGSYLGVGVYSLYAKKAVPAMAAMAPEPSLALKTVKKK